MKFRLTLALLLFCSVGFAQKDSLGQWCKQAAAAMEKKDFATASSHLQKVLTADTTNLTAWMLTADLLARQEKFQAAYDAYTRLLNWYPDNVKVYNNRGLFLNSVLQREAALADFDKALSLPIADSDRVHLLINRGVVKFDTRDYSGAYADYMNAYALDSNDLSALNGIATVCDEVGRGDETLGYLHKILQRDSAYVGAWVNIGFKYQVMGDYKTSNRYFDKALQLQPNEALSFNNRAYNKYMLNDLAGALKDVNQSLKLYPGNAYAYRNRALIYLAQKKKEPACADLAKAVEQGFTQSYGYEVEDLQKKHCR